MVHVSSHGTALYPATRGSAASYGGELTVVHHNGDANRTSARVGVYSPCQQEGDSFRSFVAGAGLFVLKSDEAEEILKKISKIVK
jgi:hypothetical protein